MRATRLIHRSHAPAAWARGASGVTRSDEGLGSGSGGVFNQVDGCALSSHLSSLTSSHAHASPYPTMPSSWPDARVPCGGSYYLVIFCTNLKTAHAPLITWSIRSSMRLACARQAPYRVPLTSQRPSPRLSSSPSRPCAWTPLSS